LLPTFDRDNRVLQETTFAITSQPTTMGGDLKKGTDRPPTWDGRSAECFSSHRQRETIAYSGSYKRVSEDASVNCGSKAPHLRTHLRMALRSRSNQWHQSALESEMPEANS